MKKKDYSIIPFNSLGIKGRRLVTNMLGGWDFLDTKEFGEFSSFSLRKDSPLFKRLRARGLIMDENNCEGLINDYRNLNAHLFNDTSLHIAVVTTRCNLQCKYCQTSTVNGADMDHNAASRVLKYIYDVKNKAVTLELQGGEPLLNWEVSSFLIEHARKFNTVDKDLRIAMVTNMTLLDDEKMAFLADNDVEVCASLDGPQDIHDKNRVFKNGKGTYELVLGNIRKMKKKFNRKVNLLPTITRYSLPRMKDIIDEYVRLEQDDIPLRPVNKIGVACSNWIDLGYSAEDFCLAYKNGMDYILALNKKGVIIRERTAKVILEKIINKRDPGYVELMNPCGAGRATIVYMPGGDCYPCDEARMVDESMFKLGNILNENYEDLMKKDNLIHLLEASIINLWDHNSVFSPWIANCPVVNYALQKNIVPKIWCSPVHKIINYQIRYIFEKMLGSRQNFEIFKTWVGAGKQGGAGG